MKNKERIDKLLIERGICEDIEKAKRIIMAGQVIVNEHKIEKPGTLVERASNIRVKGFEQKFVSRGGLKLEKAILEFQLDFKEKVVMDIGASTGGFTDCALQYGALKVFSIDVGTNQLDWKLRQDKRVVSIEEMHINNLTEKYLNYEKVDIIVVDVSFISFISIFEGTIRFIKDDGVIIVLIKPQFEAEKNRIDNGGILKDFEEHSRIILRIIENSKNKGFFCNGLTVSPIAGAKGNIEYLAMFSKNREKTISCIEGIVENGKKNYERSII